jgi:hypothetical protein
MEDKELESLMGTETPEIELPKYEDMPTDLPFD